MTSIVFYEAARCYTLGLQLDYGFNQDFGFDAAGNKAFLVSEIMDFHDCGLACNCASGKLNCRSQEYRCDSKLALWVFLHSAAG